MMFTLNLFITIIISLTAEIAESQSVAYVDSPSLNPLLTIPPYRSFLGYEKPAFLCDQHDHQLQMIAEQYDMKITDLYQLYDLVSTNLPSVSPDAYINMIQQISEVAQIERIRRGDILSNDYQQYSTSYTNPQINNQLYTLQRRDVSDYVDDLYQDTSSMMKSMYNNLYNMINYTIPETTQEFKNQISSIVNEFSPSQALDSADNLASKLQENLRYMMS